MSATADRTPTGGLWAIIAGPTVWAVHFMLCYAVAAVYCAKADSIEASLLPVRLWIAGATVAALAVISGVGRHGYRHSGAGRRATAPHDADTVADRRRFIGWATLLLAGLSFVATVFVALGALVIGTCR
jgi:hypothetical protein